MAQGQKAEGTIDRARAVVADARQRAGRLDAVRGSGVLMGVSAALRAVHLLEQLANAHERSDHELEAMALRVLLETYITGRWALLADESAGLRWTIDSDRRRGRFARAHGREDVAEGLDADHVELESMHGQRPKELPDLEHMLAELPKDEVAVRDAKKLLFEPLSNWHLHSRGDAVGRYSDVVDDQLRWVFAPAPVLPPDDLLALAVGLAGALVERALTAAERA